MRITIFSKLKQEYAHLGLGDSILQAHADALNAIGLVNDANVDAVISSQKSFLENLQKENDRRATDAYNKAKLNIKKDNGGENETETPEWFKAEKAKNDKLIKSLQDTIGELSDKNKAYEAEKQASDRLSKISAKAKALGIPEFRIQEGFAISDSADDATIENYLISVANNIKTQMLPGNKIVFPHADGEIQKSDTDAIAKSLIG